jgi:hypothetical protein
LKAATGTDLVAHQPHELALDVGGRAVDAAFQHGEAAGDLALRLSFTPDDRAFGHRRMGGQHLLHAPRRERCPATLMMSSVRPMT